jgi:hypothetical protein
VLAGILAAQPVEDPDFGRDDELSDALTATGA